MRRDWLGLVVQTFIQILVFAGAMWAYFLQIEHRLSVLEENVRQIPEIRSLLIQHMTGSKISPDALLGIVPKILTGITPSIKLP